jgi:urocanate hydratase
MNGTTPQLNSSGDKIWCPLCGDYERFLKIEKAARLSDVDRRTIHRYIEEGKIYNYKIAGMTSRVCSNCLLGRNEMFNLIIN